MHEWSWLWLMPWLLIAAAAWIGTIMHACGWMEDTDERGMEDTDEKDWD